MFWAICNHLMSASTTIKLAPHCLSLFHPSMRTECQRVLVVKLRQSTSQWLTTRNVKAPLHNTTTSASSHLTMGLWPSLEKSNKRLCNHAEEYFFIGIHVFSLSLSPSLSRNRSAGCFPNKTQAINSNTLSCRPCSPELANVVYVCCGEKKKKITSM